MHWASEAPEYAQDKYHVCTYVRTHWSGLQWCAHKLHTVRTSVTLHVQFLNVHTVWLCTVHTMYTWLNFYQISTRIYAFQRPASVDWKKTSLDWLELKFLLDICCTNWQPLLWPKRPDQIYSTAAYHVGSVRFCFGSKEKENSLGKSDISLRGSGEAKPEKDQEPEKVTQQLNSVPDYS